MSRSHDFLDKVLLITQPTLFQLFASHFFVNYWRIKKHTMELLSQSYLEQSPVVANNRMNRERNSVGVNSYEHDISLSPIHFLTRVSQTKNSVNWLDICCGKGKALIQTAQYLKIHFPNHQYNLIGVDLVDMHDPIPQDCNSISMVTKSFFNFNTDLTFDLVTCVHGLHYLGDKLEAIRKACSLLNKLGSFIANLDINNFKNSEEKNFDRKIKTWFASNDLEYNLRTHLLHVHGNKSLNIPFKYLGADDKAGPNYTGQEVVNSYYC